MGLMPRYGFFEVTQTPISHDALIEVNKFIRNMLHFCTYVESKSLKIYFEVCEPFVKGSQVCGFAAWHCAAWSYCCYCCVRESHFQFIIGKSWPVSSTAT